MQLFRIVPHSISIEDMVRLQLMDFINISEWGQEFSSVMFRQTVWGVEQLMFTYHDLLPLDGYLALFRTSTKRSFIPPAIPSLNKHLGRVCCCSVGLNNSSYIGPFYFLVLWTPEKTGVYVFQSECQYWMCRVSVCCGTNMPNREHVSLSEKSFS